MCSIVNKQWDTRVYIVFINVIVKVLLLSVTGRFFK